MPFPHFPRWLIILFLVGSGFLLATLPFLALTMGLASDFLAFYTSGQLLIRGESHALYDFDRYYALQLGWLPTLDHPFRFLYAPLFALLTFPLATFPLLEARWLWVLLNLLLLGVALHLSRGWSTLTVPESVLALLAFPPLYVTLVVGQNSPLTLLLFAAIALWLWQRRHEGMTGGLAAATLYKPQLLFGLLLLWFWRRWLRLMLAFALGAGLLLLGSLLVDPGATLAYPFLGQKMVTLMESGATGSNGSLYADLREWLPPMVASGLAGGLGLLVLVLLLLAWQHPPIRYHHAMLWLTPLLITPYVAHYDLLLLALPLSFLVPTLARDRWLQLATFLLWVGPFFNILGPFRLATWAALLLYLRCFWLSRAPHHGPA